MFPIEINNTKYTTLDRQMTFTFDFVQLPDSKWRVYIRDQPPYQGRGADSWVSHRLHDARGTYICWSAPIPTLDAAKGVARAWADSTQEYIRTGRFPAPGSRSDVPDWSSSAQWQHSGTPGRFEAGAPVAPAPPVSPRQSTSPARPASPATPSRPAPPVRPAPRQSSWLSRTLTSWRDLL